MEEEHEHDHEHAYESADDTVMTDQEGVESAAQAPDSGDELDEADLLELQKNLQEKFGQVWVLMSHHTCCAQPCVLTRWLLIYNFACCLLHLARAAWMLRGQ